MDESEGNMSAEEARSVSSPSGVKKPKKRSIVERELETNLTAHAISPILGEGMSTSRYGRARKLKIPDIAERVVKTPIDIKSPGTETTPVKLQSAAYKMHAANSPYKAEPKQALETDINNQIDTIYQENLSLSRFTDNSSPSPAKKSPKIYIQKDLIQTKDTEENIVLIKNLFSPSKSTKSKVLDSTEKFNHQNGYDNASVVKTLDFGDSKRKKKENNKPSMSKNELFDLEAKCVYQVGDLVWARMGTFPFWPSIVTREPYSDMFVKKKLFGRVEHDIIHVTFFGDNGRRSWIVDNMLRPYQGKLEFESTRDKFTPEDKKKDPRLYAAFFVSEKKQALWNTSVEEAEIVGKEPKRLRIDILNDMILKARAIKKQQKGGKISRTDSDVSLSESLYDSLFSEDDSKTDDTRLRSRSKNHKSFDVSEVVTACLDNMAAKSGITKIQRQSHMDRWLQKAKSKTPEKIQVKTTSKSKKSSKRNTKETNSDLDIKHISEVDLSMDENSIVAVLTTSDGRQTPKQEPISELVDAPSGSIDIDGVAIKKEMIDQEIDKVVDIESNNRKTDNMNSETVAVDAESKYQETEIKDSESSNMESDNFCSVTKSQNQEIKKLADKPNEMETDNIISDSIVVNTESQNQDIKVAGNECINMETDNTRSETVVINAESKNQEIVKANEEKTDNISLRSGVYTESQNQEVGKTACAVSNNMETDNIRSESVAVNVEIKNQEIEKVIDKTNENETDNISLRSTVVNTECQNQEIGKTVCNESNNTALESSNMAVSAEIKNHLIEKVGDNESKNMETDNISYKAVTINTQSEKQEIEKVGSYEPNESESDSIRLESAVVNVESENQEIEKVASNKSIETYNITSKTLAVNFERKNQEMDKSGDIEPNERKIYNISTKPAVVNVENQINSFIKKELTRNGNGLEKEVTKCDLVSESEIDDCSPKLVSYPKDKEEEELLNAPMQGSIPEEKNEVEPIFLGERPTSPNTKDNVPNLSVTSNFLNNDHNHLHDRNKIHLQDIIMIEQESHQNQSDKSKPPNKIVINNDTLYTTNTSFDSKEQNQGKCKYENVSFTCNTDEILQDNNHVMKSSGEAVSILRTNITNLMNNNSLNKTDPQQDKLLKKDEIIEKSCLSYTRSNIFMDTNMNKTYEQKQHFFREEKLNISAIAETDGKNTKKSTNVSVPNKYSLKLTKESLNAVEEVSKVDSEIEEYEIEDSDDEPSPEYEPLGDDITEDFRQHMISIENNVIDKKNEIEIVKVCDEIVKTIKKEIIEASSSVIQQISGLTPNKDMIDNDKDTSTFTEIKINYNKHKETRPTKPLVIDLSSNKDNTDAIDTRTIAETKTNDSNHEDSSEKHQIISLSPNKDNNDKEMDTTTLTKIKTSDTNQDDSSIKQQVNSLSPNRDKIDNAVDTTLTELKIYNNKETRLKKPQVNSVSLNKDNIDYGTDATLAEINDIKRKDLNTIQLQINGLSPNKDNNVYNAKDITILAETKRYDNKHKEISPVAERKHNNGLSLRKVTIENVVDTTKLDVPVRDGSKRKKPIKSIKIGENGLIKHKDPNRQKYPEPKVVLTRLKQISPKAKKLNLSLKKSQSTTVKDVSDKIIENIITKEKLKEPKIVPIDNDSVETTIPVAQQNGCLKIERIETPDTIDDDFDIDAISVNSEDSDTSVNNSNYIPRRSLRSREKKIDAGLENSKFLQYLELRQDYLMDEHPELTEDDIVAYLYKTWQYEENLKSDVKKSDDVHQSSLVKGILQETPINKKSKKSTPKNRIEKYFKANNKKKKIDFDTEAVPAQSEICDGKDQKDDNLLSASKNQTDVANSNSPTIEPNKKFNSSDLFPNNNKEELPKEVATSKRSLRAKIISPKHVKIPEHDITKTNSPELVKTPEKDSPIIELKVEDTIDTESITSEDSEVPLRQLRTKVLKEKDRKESQIKKIKEESDDVVSISSDDEPLNKHKKKRNDKNKATKTYDDPDFVKFLELRQDALMDENPQLTHEEIVEYLYKTWLYEENAKSDLKKNDEIEQSSLVKGLNQDVPKKVKRKPREKIEKVIDDKGIDDQLIVKDKPKRKTIPAYYNEDFSDIEDEIEMFEIFKPRAPKEEVKIENKISDIQTETTLTFDEEYVQDNDVAIVDSLDFYFADLLKPKPNVFKGLIREKVCEICERTNDLYKCKGCNGMFHSECIKKQTEITKSPAPSRGRKLKKKRGKKHKSIEDSGSQSDVPEEDANNSIEDLEACTFNAETIEAQIEAKMKEIIDCNEAHYDSYSSDDCIDWSDTIAGKCQIVDVKLKPRTSGIDYTNFKCHNCQKYDTPICFVCKQAVSKNDVKIRQKCHIAHCNKYYHLECLDHWPQTQFYNAEPSKTNKKVNEYFEALTCPRHVCHTCVSDDPRGCKTRFCGDKLAKCVRCPATYHSFTKCLPAGSQILTASHIICPRHNQHNTKPGKIPCHVNTGWCFICALGGSLICCEYCPTSFHAECLNIKPPEGNYMCEDCETGRLPLYGEMVWVKLGQYRWWPGLILHPSEIPENIMAVKHNMGEFVVRFFGQYDHYWVNRGRVFPYQEGDSGRISSQKSKIDAAFTMAMEHAQRAFEILKTAEPNEEESQDIASSLLPPHYVKLKCNKPVGSLTSRREDPALSLTQCECSPDEVEPCGPYSHCLNRMLLTECGPTCQTGERCNNRAFEKRLYPKLVPYRTPHRGWGLKTLENIKAGQFVIEYVGELIDEEEFRRRMRRKHEIRDENFYFLTLDKERMIDAGPKGNLARFMNHCCEPNCETQKWTVLGDIRVGLFAINDIPANSEVTFNYNLECAGIEKKRCLCGAKRCSGYIGAKPKQDETKKSKDGKSAKRVYKKRKPEESPTTKNKQKRPIGRPPKPKELTEIEKDLLIIKSASNNSSGESSRSQSVDDKPKAAKRKASTESMAVNGPEQKKQKLETNIDSTEIKGVCQSKPLIETQVEPNESRDTSNNGIESKRQKCDVVGD